MRRLAVPDPTVSCPSLMLPKSVLDFLAPQSASDSQLRSTERIRNSIQQ